MMFAFLQWPSSDDASIRARYLSLTGEEISPSLPVNGYYSCGTGRILYDHIVKLKSEFTNLVVTNNQKFTYSELLKWTPPVQNNPTVIYIDADNPPTSDIILGNTEDAIIVLPNKPLIVPELQITYGRHVRIIGGHIIATDPTSTSKSAALRCAGQSGSIYIEGLLIDCQRVDGKDGIEVGGANGYQGDVYIQNCHIKNVYSNPQSALHADAVQFWGPVNNVYLDKVTGISQGQAFFLDPQNGVGSINASRIDSIYLDPQNGTGYSFFLRSNPSSPVGRPIVTLDQVYVDQRAGYANWQDYSVFPSSTGGAAYDSATGEISFNATYPEITGVIKKWTSGKGYFVPEQNVGTGYNQIGFLI